MFEGSSIVDVLCQPMLAYCGRKAKLSLRPDTLSALHHLKFNKLDAFFSYDIKICRFDSSLFSEETDVNFAFIVETTVFSSDPFDLPVSDANVFLEKNFDDLIEYSIILPRMFKRHERYVLNMEKDSPCSFGNFTNKVELWKKDIGIT
ncbi:hypothetical protein CMI37_03595 [Candidatus Pacearchaeota archaeon]|nr:hypothetical protein [Candidatus Pacearchaeota archaeon]|tara:strand:+ start:642 stop:1085 length:444 start_codon:yes stop_codon:yes gene_type:complete